MATQLTLSVIPRAFCGDGTESFILSSQLIPRSVESHVRVPFPSVSSETLTATHTSLSDPVLYLPFIQTSHQRGSYSTAPRGPNPRFQGFFHKFETLTELQDSSHHPRASNKIKQNSVICHV